MAAPKSVAAPETAMTAAKRSVTATKRPMTATKRAEAERSVSAAAERTPRRAEWPVAAPEPRHRRPDDRRAGHGNEHRRREDGDGQRRGRRSDDGRMHGVRHGHRPGGLDLRLDLGGWCRLRLRRNDDVLVRAGAQGDRRANAARQRNLERNNDGDENHCERTTYRQKVLAPL